MNILNNKKTTPHTTNKTKKIVVKTLFFISILSVFTFSASFKPEKITVLDTKDTIYVYDTVILYDTEYIYDTIYYNKYKITDTLSRLAKKIKYGNIILQDSNYIIIKKDKQYRNKKIKLFSLDFIYSPLYSNQKFKSNTLYSEFTQKNNDAFTPSLGNNINLNINYHNKKTTLTTGINYTNYKLNFSAISLYDKIDTITLTLIDTIKFINIDTLLATGDTVYYYITDTTYKQIPDTTQKYYYDKSKNSYKYIEIPLILGKSTNISNLNLTAEIGIIASFFVNSKGKIVSLTDINKTDNIKEKPEFANLKWSLYSGVKLNYAISNKLQLITSVFFRKNINSVFKDYPVITGINSLGFGLGLRYKILF